MKEKGHSFELLGQAVSKTESTMSKNHDVNHDLCRIKPYELILPETKVILIFQGKLVLNFLVDTFLVSFGKN